jgi:hypothetical protein
VFALGVLVTLALFTREAAALDASLYAKLLAEHTVAVADVASTRVDYGTLRRSNDLGAVIESLRAADPSRLRSTNETKAFWINAYNILAIDLVARRYPTDSIRSGAIACRSRMQCGSERRVPRSAFATSTTIGG